MESSDKDQGKKNIPQVKTFPVPFPLGENKDNITITTNTPSKPSKEQIINQAFKFHSQGNISEAAKYYQYCIKQGFNNHLVFSNYGTILQGLGKLQDAEISTRKAIEIKPDLAEAHYNLGNILIDLGKLQEAELSTRKAIELNPEFAEAHLNLGNILKDLGKLQEAELSHRKAIELKPDLAEAHLNLGNILKDLDKLQEAELSHRKAIEINPDFAEAHSNLGNILKDLGKLQDAELSTRKAIEIRPDLAEAHLNLGNILKDLDKLQEAELSHRKAIEIKPDYAQAHSNLGNILSDQGKLKEAELSHRKAIELNPHFAEAHYNLGNILSDQGKLKEAELSQRKAIELNPHFAEAYSNLGLILIDMGKLQEAEVSTRRAIDLEPNSAKWKLNLGINQFAQGDINSSLKTLESAYRLEQNNRQINSLRAILKGRKKKKPKNLRVENITKSLFDDQFDWNPIVLHRSVEEELIQKLYSLKTKESSRPIYGNIQGSDYSLFENDIPILKYFQKDLIRKLSEYFNSEISITESFFNIIVPKDGVGGGSKIHGHLNRVDRIPQLDIEKQKFSLVYYLSIGDKSSKDKGILKFHNPNKDFLPEEGMIVIFPASRLHSVHYNGKKDRVVIVVNFYLL